MLTQISKRQVSNPREAHVLLTKIVHNTKVSFVEMGAILKYLKQNDRFKEAIGIEDWNDYLKQPEISITQGEANRMIQIYETFCERLGYSIDRIANVPVKNIHYLLPLAKEEKDKEKIDNLLSDAEVLTQKDFREKVFEDKNTGKKTFEYFIMERCKETGNMKKIYDVPETEILALINKYTTEKYF